MDGTREIIFSEVKTWFRSQRPNVFSPKWIVDQKQIQQYYEKQVMLRGSHI
jgi:hypothetical protein